jgi:hypothetical protein
VGVDGTKTSVYFNDAASVPHHHDSGGGSFGGHGGSGGSGGNSYPSPEGGILPNLGPGWNNGSRELEHVVTTLRQEVFSGGFNTLAGQDGGERLQYHVNQIRTMEADRRRASDPSFDPMTIRPILVVERPEATQGRVLWMDYGTRLDQPRTRNDGTTETHRGGAIHLHEAHGHDFKAKGISETDVMKFVQHLATSDVLQSGRNSKGNYDIIESEGTFWRLCYGENGFIKTVFPDKRYKTRDK